MLIIVFVGVMCAYVAVKIFSATERTEVFNRRPIEVQDVKKYNRFCGYLVVGFGVAAELTLTIGILCGGVISIICIAVMLLEAYIVLRIYSKNEIKMIRKR